ncbi:MAG: L,D-transpeptidase family protein [Bacillota bacterium]|nr:L,D-transpeptidase family protein [Bacillota bacterium]
MKKMKKMMCILTAVAMLFTMTGLGVFAAEEVESPAEDQVVGTQDSDLESAVVEVQDVDAAENESPKPVIIPDKPVVTALSGFHSVKLKWNKSNNAEAYNIGFRNANGKWESVGVTRNLEIEKKGLKARNNYKFRVFAVRLKEASKNKANLTYHDINGETTNGVWTGEVSEPTYVDKQCVARMEIAVTLKKTRTYGGVKMKAGTRVITDGYSAGNYYFDNPRGKRAYVARIAARGARADYQPNGDYGLESAEFFINDYLNSNKSLKPKNGRVIWVSTYTQHLYMFKEEGGKYVSLNGYNWPVSMGKATTPSPTGNKMIKKRISARHGIKFWSCYSGMNALHGVKGSWGKKLGRLASHGCIRNPKDGAAKIWQNCKKGTRVIVY